MSNNKLTKVSMNLTEKDLVNTKNLKERLHARSNADAVSAALSIVSSLSKHISEGEELYIRKKSGNSEKIIIPGLDD